MRRIRQADGSYRYDALWSNSSASNETDEHEEQLEQTSDEEDK